MSNIAIIGTGIAGMASAWYLRHNHNLTIYEKQNRAGGHTHTHQVNEENCSFPIDTGFIVFNKKTYPHLIRMFNELKIDSGETEMSFSVYNTKTGMQFCSAGISGLFAQKKNIFSPSYLQMLFQIRRFSSEAINDVKKGRANMPLLDYLKNKKISNFTRDNFLIPIGSAVWSTPAVDMLNFPASTFIQFSNNHSFFDLYSGIKWLYVKGGSESYTKKVISSLSNPIRLPEKVLEVEIIDKRVIVRTKQSEHEYDKVLIATHAPDALAMLKNFDQDTINILKKFRYSGNTAILHTDSSVMPPNRKVWSSWNAKITDEGLASTVYYMNRLQHLPTKKDYFVSLNETTFIDPKKIIAKMDYEHPLFDEIAINAQPKLLSINKTGPVYFAGAYFRYGFHEDGMIAALNAVKSIGAD